MRNTLGLALTILLLQMVCFGQSSYKNLTPGKSTRADVDRVLGQSVKELSQTLVEYGPNGDSRISKIYVQYRKDAALVERIEILLTQPINRTDVVTALRLPQTATSSRTNARGTLEEYYGAPSYIVLTYAGADVGSGVTRTGRYSRELFDSAIASVPRPAQNSATQSSSSGNGAGSLKPMNSDLPGYMSPPAGASSVTVTRAGRSQPSSDNSCFAATPGVGRTTRSVHYDWAKQQSAATLDEHLKNKLDLLLRCASRTDDQLASSFADISVVIAKHVPNANCFDGDRGVISTDGSSHYQWARSKTREQMRTNITWKVLAAMRCLDRNAQNDFYADVSVIVAKSGS